MLPIEGSAELVNDKADDEAKYVAYGKLLVDAFAADIEPWLRAAVDDRIGDQDDELQTQIAAVAQEVVRSITELVTADVDTPLSGPLERVRRAVEPLTIALDERNAPLPSRDPIDSQMRPDDRYALGPMTFLDISQDVHNAGIAWGAAKAHLHMRRRHDG